MVSYHHFRCCEPFSDAEKKLKIYENKIKKKIVSDNYSAYFIAYDIVTPQRLTIS